MCIRDSGISGSITSYGDSFIENCQAYGDVSSSLHQVGGIVGYIVSKGETAVDGCIAYGQAAIARACLAQTASR